MRSPDADLALLVQRCYEGTPPAGWWVDVDDGLGNVQMWICRRPGELVIVLPGTNERRDWRSNLWPWPSKIYGTPGRWRAGFRRAAAAVYPRVQRAIWGVPASSRVAIVGHSFGGAVAVAVVAHMKRDAPDREVEAITFGAPRVCSAKAAAYVADLGRRYALEGDVVPAVVPGWWRHALRPMWKHDETTLGALMRQGWKVARVHSMANYRKALLFGAALLLVGCSASVGEPAPTDIYSHCVTYWRSQDTTTVDPEVRCKRLIWGREAHCERQTDEIRPSSADRPADRAGRRS